MDNHMNTSTYPDAEWERRTPAEENFDPEILDNAKQWFDGHADEYRLVIARNGRIVAEWNRGIDQDDRQVGIASAAKSIYSNILGIVVREGKIPSADACVFDYYPEMMDVPKGEGPKTGRYAFEKDRDITFRQLISNTSGYMKPGEDPGKVFHYQTFGMNILTHTLAKVYGYYDVNKPVESLGFQNLVKEKLADPIGANFKYSLRNFDLPPKARINIFGYYCEVHSTALDLARLGWLWCNLGRWKDKRVIPEPWMRESIRTAPNIVSNCPQDQWRYGYGFWTNEYRQLWPDLPRSGFAAAGAGGNYIYVFPDHNLVVVQNPGPILRDEAGTGIQGNPILLKTILNAIKK